jgi:hypothetical protein
MTAAWPASQAAAAIAMSRHVDFMPGAVDQCHVDMFEVFGR